MWPRVEALSIHDAAHDVFMTLSLYISIREDEVQPILEGARKRPIPAWRLVERVGPDRDVLKEKTSNPSANLKHLGSL